MDTYFELVADGPVAALAGLAAYETQASAIASTKADGLRRWYGLDAAGTEFWDVHARMDADHGEWAVDALARLGADPAEVAERPAGGPRHGGRCSTSARPRRRSAQPSSGAHHRDERDHLAGVAARGCG